MKVDERLIDKENGSELILDTENDRFYKAFELVKNSNENLFITGKAGTGKTTFLKYVKNNIKKNIAIVAYTGVASVNAGGQTIHSFFKIDPTEAPFTPWDKRLRFNAKDDILDKTNIFSHFQYNLERIQTIKALEILIIDEVSMVRADFIDVIDRILRAFGRNRNLPFGGVKVILIGDTFQLPPIEGKEWEILSQFYDSPFFFSAKSILENPPIQIELDKIYRQSEIEFINILNRIRVNQPSEGDISLLNNKVRPISNKDFDDNFIVLCSTNAQVNEINLQRLNSISTVEFEYKGLITGTFPKSACVTEMDLRLKEGAQVMTLKNGVNYHNGKIGTIKSLEKDRIVLELKNKQGEVIEAAIGLHTWENVTFNYNNETRQIERKVVGSFKQYPVKLAWAITIHKSQGLTFEKVIININDFTPSGSTYVALSRCTSLNGLVLSKPIQRKAINTDARVIEYAKKVAPESLIIELLNDGKADDLYKEARGYFKAGSFDQSFDFLLKAIKYRNDIETPAFRKFLNVQFEKFKFYRSYFRENLNELSKNIKLVKSQIVKISKLEKKVLDLDQSNSDSIRVASDLRKQVSKVREELSDYQNRNAEEKRTSQLLISKLNREIDLLKRELVSSKNLIKSLEKENGTLRTLLSEQQLEILRLNKLTLFDKLLGKK